MQIDNYLLSLQTYFFVLTLNLKQMISEIRKKIFAKYGQ